MTSSRDPDVFVNPIKIDGFNKPFTYEAEHLGIIRSTAGNGPSILARLSVHKRALAAVPFTGMAQNHRGSPACSIKINQLYATPVLLSGISFLGLLKKDIETVNRHRCATLRRLLRLCDKIPRSVIYFLA